VDADHRLQDEALERFVIQKSKSETRMTKQEIQQLIEAGLPGASVKVFGDDGQHFEAEVVCAEFAGKLPLAQHRMVYATLGDKMGRDIHALQLRTRAA
jgi:acid stress-induced BolA-like protein IbaG/YrbA